MSSVVFVRVILVSRICVLSVHFIIIPMFLFLMNNNKKHCEVAVVRDPSIFSFSRLFYYSLEGGSRIMYCALHIR